MSGPGGAGRLPPPVGGRTRGDHPGLRRRTPGLE